MSCSIHVGVTKKFLSEGTHWKFSRASSHHLQMEIAHNIVEIADQLANIGMLQIYSILVSVYLAGNK